MTTGGAALYSPALRENSRARRDNMLKSPFTVPHHRSGLSGSLARSQSTNVASQSGQRVSLASKPLEHRPQKEDRSLVTDGPQNEAPRPSRTRKRSIRFPCPDTWKASRGCGRARGYAGRNQRTAALTYVSERRSHPHYPPLGYGRCL